MSELLQEQEREINECLRAHLIQMTNSAGMIDFKKIFAYLTLLMEYECFTFAINKENMDLLQKSFDFILKSLSENREVLNEGFKGCSETQLKKLQIMFFKCPTNEYFAEEVEIEGEKEKEVQDDFKPLPIAKGTLKNFRDILDFN